MGSGFTTVHRTEMYGTNLQMRLVQEFHDGEPAIRLQVSLQVEEPGLFESLFGASRNPGESLDLCNLECLQAVDLESRTESLLADIDSKDRLLDDPDPKLVVSEEFSTIE